eukprot:CAMPEP_0202467266 /NCGR_PEP_ID=MMETSP1360-20130828/71434_1 /ASSEMBLY_ACC=CAM_ASM_000848 /TAXON_ID=515479 /ORGANISM="Licmophora paradoxa, Strain CCMP2313" /LENGTH=62 /DNA_ID=CAMNT_0049091739 /DNA_START=10 /DNA_END=194 /DNA_ORIENTATION=+
MASSTLYIRLSTGHKFPVTISDPLTEVTVLALKNLIAENQTDCPAERQRLIYKGRILDDTRT